MIATRSLVPQSTGEGRPARLAICLIALATSGCAWVPRGRIEDCRQRVQVLQASNQELRDVAVRVRQDNRDLAQRSLDDSRRIRAQEEALRRYERSIADYQDEREQLHALIDQIRGEVRTAAHAPTTTAMLDRLESFARDNPDCQLDPNRGLIQIPSDSLFQSEGPELSDAGRSLLDALAGTLSGPETSGLSLAVTSVPIASRSASTDPEIQRASADSGSSEAPRSDSLESARRIRDHLADRLNLPTTRIAISAGGSTASDQITIQVRRIGDQSP